VQFHFWEYINRNQTFILDSHRHFICSVLAIIWGHNDLIFTSNGNTVIQRFQAKIFSRIHSLRGGPRLRLVFQKEPKSITIWLCVYQLMELRVGEDVGVGRLLC
jgi:hypothetical protein